MALKRPHPPVHKNSGNVMKNLAFWAALLFIGFLLFAVFAKPDNLAVKSFSDVIERANKGEIKAMYIMGENPALSEPDSSTLSRL